MTNYSSTPMMRSFAAAVRANVPVILWGNPGEGKALDTRTPIATPSGWSTMGDLETGDQVFDETGQPCTVTATYDQPDNRECFDVTFDDGSVITADRDHLWATHTRAYRVLQRNDLVRVRQQRGTAEQVAAIDGALAFEAPGLTTVSQEVSAFAAAGVTTKLVADAASHILPTCAVGSSGHVWRAADVRSVGLPTLIGSDYMTWQALMDLGVSRSSARWHLAKIAPVTRFGGSLFERTRLIESLRSVLASQSYNQMSKATKPLVSTTAEIASTLTVDNGLRLNHSVPVAGSLDLPDVDLPVAPYTLGAWLGDGNTADPAVTTMDQEVLRGIEGDGYTTHLQPSSAATCGQARTYGISRHPDGDKKGSDSMAARFRSIGVIGAKHIPAVYFRASHRQRLALLTGLLDTDGTCGPSGVVVFAVTHEQLGRDFHELALSLGFKAWFSTRPAPGGRVGRQTQWRTTFTPSRTVFSVSRKATRQVIAERGVQSNRYIVSITPVASVPVRCITVDSSSHLYLAGRSMIPTHNTAVVESFGRANGFHVETVSGANREASDYLGLPVEVDGEVHYSSLAWAKRLADAPKGLFFGDEASTNSLSVQKAMLRILQERVVGELQLPDTVAMVLAANPPSVAVDGLELPAAVANRIFHLDWHFDSQAWLDGIITDFAHVAPPQIDTMLGAGSDADVARVRGAVTAFLRTRPQLLNSTPPTNPVQAGKGWCSPRSWHNTMKILAELDRDDEDAELLVLRGCVGDGAATEYLAWKVAMDLHDPEAVLADPSIVRWGAERPDRLFALISSVTALTLARGDKTTWDKGVAVLVSCARGGFGGERTGPGKPDVATPGARTLFNNMPTGAKVSMAARDAFATILARTGRWESAA